MEKNNKSFEILRDLYEHFYNCKIINVSIGSSGDANATILYNGMEIHINIDEEKKENKDGN